MTKIISPDGWEFEIEEEANTRILMEGLPVILGDSHEKQLTTKEGDHFILTNLDGNIPEENYSGLGLYLGDTRYLSTYFMTVCGKEPVLLSSSMETDYLSQIEMTNADLDDVDGQLIKQQTLNVRRKRIVRNGYLERLELKNYNDHKVKLSVELVFASDFADIFEVRGYRRTSRGRILRPKLVTEQKLVLAYQGEDDSFHQTVVELPFKPQFENFLEGSITLGFEIELEARGETNFDLKFLLSKGVSKPHMKDFEQEVNELKMVYGLWERNCAAYVSDNALLNSVIKRSQNDVRALCSRTEDGFVIEAGVPWFATIFGRDSIIASIQLLSFNPEIARATILCLARYQGKKVDDWRDEEPGKILHELRRGELASLNVIPHSPYFGSVDSTPLFLILIWEYYKWTGDVELVRSVLPNIKAALDWIDKYGDMDQDGFVEYHRASPKGLINQGWKDSYNAVTHLNGKAAQSPIALAEVQGYVYSAKSNIAKVYRELGHETDAKALEKSAKKLKDKFNELFWMEKEKFYCLALDGDKKQVKTVTSNPGHCLWTRIIDEERAPLVAKRLVSEDMFSGWGIRTLSKTASSYNPMSYHNGSVWPHDNAIIIAGLKKYGLDSEVNLVATSLFDSAIHHAYYRLPELFCGFTRRQNNWPVSYPVACSPQAWAAGAVFLLLQTIAGLSPDSRQNTLRIRHPAFPKWCDKITLKNLRVADSFIDISLSRVGQVTALTILKRTGDVNVVLEE